MKMSPRRDAGILRLNRESRLVGRCRRSQPREPSTANRQRFPFPPPPPPPSPAFPYVGFTALASRGARVHVADHRKAGVVTITIVRSAPPRGKECIRDASSSRVVRYAEKKAPMTPI